MNRFGRRSATVVHGVALLAIALATGCSLTETAVTDAEDVVVLELILRAGGADPQRAFLHRTVGTNVTPSVPGAQIEVTNGAGVTMTFAESDVRDCVEEDSPGPLDGSCYVQGQPSFSVVPGETYTLRAGLPDGRVLTGTTTVPGEFEVTRPAIEPCRLEPDQSFELRWTQADAAWVYVAETELEGLADALDARGVDLDEDPLTLVGLAISSQDTTLTFPTGFGLFDRADPDVADALIEIQGGLPPEVSALVVVGAADRNYVNWVRGGNFNPSGLVRVPSVMGDGTGVFGSVVTKSVVLSTRSADRYAGCQ